MKNPKFNDKPLIHKWQQFIKYVRPEGCQLLYNLHEYPTAVLVTGCQRSGTTILSRVITGSEGMVDFWFGRDDELDAAQILSGYIDYKKEVGRYCFQTTYLNECYTEYFNQETSYKIIWLLRNPYSVVYSMLHNWKRFALNDLFKGCGYPLLSDQAKSRYDHFGNFSLSALRRACLAYKGKLQQLDELTDNFSRSHIMVVEYNDLVLSKHETLEKIYHFINLPYLKKYGDSIHTGSLKKQDKLSKRETELITNVCLPIYENCKQYISY